MPLDPRIARDVERRRLRIVRRLLAWGRANERKFDWRDPERSPYEVLVAEMLLKRTTSTAAARVYPIFLEKFPTISAVAEAPAPYLEDALRSVGLYKQRALGFQQLAAHVRDTHEGEVPSTIASLERLPHAGPYSARAVVSFALGKRAAVVDSNVVRIITRIFRDSLPDRPTEKVLQEVADALLPKREHRAYNYALLDFGASVCRYVRPKCADCPLADLCDAVLD